MKRLVSMIVAVALAAVAGCGGDKSAPAAATEQFTQGGGSMEPGIKPGQVITARRVADYTPKRGDVVLFHPPADWSAKDTPMLKRVLAVGGEVVACCTPAGKVTVNGAALDETYLGEDGPLDAQPDPRSCLARRFGPVAVPQGSVFLAGDHRVASNDSRCLGPIPASAVFAVVAG
ncbi:signal peptidase I [Dactylosporangium sp. NPDC049140]|uniref:signal peptidase I n=1 Tax=Dactylosporangium sp. NPDC049140 TaxID=3155647 RepID=UPI0033C2A065